MYSKNLSTKRINNDIKEIYKNPIEGIGIISLDNDIKKYIVNIMLMSGPYKNYCLQLLLTFPDDYPIGPPKILIYPGQLFDNLYHRHIFIDENNKDEDGKCFKKLCLDLNTGWNPSYTISSLLMQVQIFLANPDMSETSMPKAYQIKELMESMNNYQRKFSLKDENENKEIIKTHTWKDPYPEMYFKEKESTKNINNFKLDEKNKIIKENLTCFMSKMNIFDEPNIILGYPIVKETTGKIYPIPEIISYEGFLAQIYHENSESNTSSLKSANNKYYNSWLPIYINKINFETNKQTILNSFSVIKYGISGEKDFDFKPEYIYEIMFKLINQMVWDIKEQKISSSYFRAFFQYILLYKKLSGLYPCDYQENAFNYEDFINSEDFISKLEEIMVISLFEKFALLEKYLNNLKEELKNYLAISFFLEKQKCELNSPKEFVEYLDKNNLFNSIYEIMRSERNLFLYNGKNLKGRIKKIICNSFRDFILNSDENTKDNLKKFLIKKTKFYNFIDFFQFIDNELNEESKKNINDVFANFIIFCYIKEKINEKNFMNQLENNFGVYLDIDETFKKLNNIINNVDIYFSDELDFFYQSVWYNIQNIIQELFILNNNINKKPSKDIFGSDSFFPGYCPIGKWEISTLYKKISDYLTTMNNTRKILYDSSFGSYNINHYKKEQNSFDKLENMSLDNLKLLYLYCFQRMEKSIYPDDTNLSLIESIFIDCSLNNNKNNYEWYNYILQRQIEANKEAENEDSDKKLNCLDQKDLILLFNIAKRINEGLFSDNKIYKQESKGRKGEKNPNSVCFSFSEKIFLEKALIRNIEKFAQIISDQNYMFDNSFYSSEFLSSIQYYVSIDDSLIKKLKEIYKTRDAALLTFYEFIWFEEHYNKFPGFLSAYDKMYNYRMRKIINEIKNAKVQSFKKIDKKDKRYSRILFKKKTKFANNKINLLNSKKISLWKVFRPCKIKKTNYFKYILGKNNNR